MAKSVKHKRARKDDFKKLKLKIGRKLKKAQNETKTDFKARKIILTEQLSVKARSSLITKKQLNIKELVSRLNHHSPYVRQDGVSGMQEIISSNIAHDLAPYLSTLIQSLAKCLLDNDRLIRQSAIKVIEAIIIKVGNRVQPYFTLLASHLSCAMVHLNTGVQSDSLLLMDVFVSHTTSLIAEKSNSLLKNYLSLISRKIDRPSTGDEKKPIISHTLISNPNSKLATQKFRINLLKNFCNYLTAILSEKRKLENSIPLNSWQVIQIGCMPTLMKEGGSRALVQKIKILTDETEAKSFISILVPLLFQIWSEVHSKQKESSIGNPLDLEATQTLTAISEIIILLWNITLIVTQLNPANCTWFMEVLKEKLGSDILNGFPYCNLEIAKGKVNGKSQIDTLEECQNLNVILASLSFLYQRRHFKRDCVMASFYCDLLSGETKYKYFKFDDVASTVSQLIEDKHKLPIKLREELLTASLKCYQRAPSRYKMCLHNILLAASSQKCYSLWRSKNSKSSWLRDWMTFLIEEALECSDPSHHVFDVLLQFRLRNTPGFAEIMSKKKDKFKNMGLSNASSVHGIEVVV